MVQPRAVSAIASSNSARRRLTCVGLNTRGGNLAGIKHLPDQFQTARAIADVQMQNAGLAAHHPAHVSLRRQPQQLVNRWLTRPVITDRDFTHANNAIDMRDIAADRSSQRAGRQYDSRPNDTTPKVPRPPGPAPPPRDRRWCG